MTHERILIVDFGSQVTQLIARRVREEGVYCEIVPYQKAAEAFAAMQPKAVILSGGPASVLPLGSFNIVRLINTFFLLSKFSKNFMFITILS